MAVVTERAVASANVSSLERIPDAKRSGLSLVMLPLREKGPDRAGQTRGRWRPCRATGGFGAVVCGQINIDQPGQQCTPSAAAGAR